MKTIPKAIFISHGGGPLPLLGDPAHQEMVSCLQNIATSFPEPKAIVVVSAHWEESVPVITAGQNPSLIYDYYGFPPESYTIQYPCSGEPVLAKEIQRLLEQAQIKAGLDDARGLDHGVFVPLKIMYPQANIPCVQLSLFKSLDPAQHVAMGKALAALHKQDVLVIGSGFSFHNMQAFFSAGSNDARQLNHAFDAWLTDVCCNADYLEEHREEILLNWAAAPGARYCHPREEHLLPLHVCYGVAQSPASESFSLTILNKKSCMFVW